MESRKMAPMNLFAGEQWRRIENTRVDTAGRRRRDTWRK